MKPGYDMYEAFSDHFLNVDGKSLHYRLWDRESKQSIVFLHGAIANEVWWHPVAAAIQKRSFTLDLLGHGQSDWQEVYSLSSHAENVMALIQDQNLQDVVLIGHSYGGAVAALVRAYMPTIKIILVDTPIYLLQAEVAMSSRRYFKPVYRTKEEAIARFKPIPNQPIVRRDLLQMIAEASLKEVPGGYSWQFDPSFHKRKITKEEQEKIKLAVNHQQYWYGEFSPFATEASLITARSLGMSVGMIKNAFHAVPIDNPDVLVDKINEL
jgi:pimeloyl-ACP methyl ester carboxylesterase